ncbi:MAG: hypothetical protein R2733_17585 [Acidimicrobiales bacterium]
MIAGLALPLVLGVGCSSPAPELTAVALGPVEAVPAEWTYEQDHFVLVYSGPDDPADKLAEWNNTPLINVGEIRDMPFRLLFDEIDCKDGAGTADLTSVDLGTEITYTVGSVEWNVVPLSKEVGRMAIICQETS